MKTSPLLTQVYVHWPQLKFVALEIYAIGLKYCSWSLVIYISNQSRTMTQIRCTFLCWNVAVTCLLLTYSCQITNPVVSRSFIFQYIYIIDNMFFINIELFCRHIPHFTVHQRYLSGHISSSDFSLFLYPQKKIGVSALLSMRAP